MFAGAIGACPAILCPVAKEIRVLAADIDGTVSSVDGRVLESTSTTLAELKARGLILVLVTSRPPRWVVPVARSISHDGWCVAGSGTTAWLNVDGVRPSHELGYRVEDVAVIRRITAAYFTGATFGLELFDSFATDLGFPVYALSDKELQVQKIPRSAGVRISKLLCHVGSAPKRDISAFTQRMLGVGDCYMIDCRRGVMEIRPPGINKRVGLALVANYLGVSRSEVAAVGDTLSDLPMLEWAGVSIAMGQSPEALKAIATHVAPSFVDDGFAVGVRAAVLDG